MIYSEREFDGRHLTLRDLEFGDIARLVSYWHEADPSYLEFLGVDPAKLGTRGDTEKRFAELVGARYPQADRVCWVSTLGDEIIAYTNFHFVSSHENYIHAHIVDPSVRGKGLGSSSLVRLMSVAFKQFSAIERLLLVTQPHNDRINRLLSSANLPMERAYLEEPDGLPLPGWFNVFAVDRELVEAFAAPVAAGQNGSRS